MVEYGRPVPVEMGMKKTLTNCGMRNVECGMWNAESSDSFFYSEFRTPNSEFGSPNCELRTSHLGMTFIEIIVVMIIVGILAAIVLPRIDFGATSSGAAVAGAANIIASDIRYTQEFAMANRVTKSVLFTSGSGTYTFSPTNNLDPSGQLPSGVTISNNFTVTFNSLGEPTTGGGGSVSISGGGLTKTISVVNYTGKVNIS
jgi:prepilin-type N-terminal cleavage/methylation domain-containing protein